jgi:hypothetical protein
MLEKRIATNVPAKVSDDITKLTGEPAQSFLSFSQQALVN